MNLWKDGESRECNSDDADPCGDIGDKVHNKKPLNKMYGSVCIKSI